MLFVFVKDFISPGVVGETAMMAFYGVKVYLISLQFHNK